MLVLCTGMYRSGSTWSFNVAKALIDSASKSVYADYSEDIQAAFAKFGDRYDHMVVKCHAVDAIGRNLIKHAGCWTVYTFRDPLDAVWSGMQVFKVSFEDALQKVKDSLDFLKFQSQAEDVHFIWYDDITDYPLRRIEMLAEYLGVDAPPGVIRRIAKALDREQLKEKLQKIDKKKSDTEDTGYSVYDKKTLFHKGHVRQDDSSGYENFTDEQIEKAVKALKGYVDEDCLLLDEFVNIGRLPEHTALPRPPGHPHPHAPAALTGPAPLLALPAPEGASPAQALVPVAATTAAPVQVPVPASAVNIAPPPDTRSPAALAAAAALARRESVIPAIAQRQALVADLLSDLAKPGDATQTLVAAGTPTRQKSLADELLKSIDDARRDRGVQPIRG